MSIESKQEGRDINGRVAAKIPLLVACERCNAQVGHQCRKVTHVSRMRRAEKLIDAQLAALTV